MCDFSVTCAGWLPPCVLRRDRCRVSVCFLTQPRELLSWWVKVRQSLAAQSSPKLQFKRCFAPAPVFPFDFYLSLSFQFQPCFQHQILECHQFQGAYRPIAGVWDCPLAMYTIDVPALKYYFHYCWLTLQGTLLAWVCSAVLTRGSRAVRLGQYWLMSCSINIH